MLESGLFSSQKGWKPEFSDGFLDADALINLLGEAEEALGAELIHTHTLGGERFVRVRRLSRSDWLEKYYLGAGR